MNKLLAIPFFMFALSGCSDSSSDDNHRVSGSERSFPSLPTNDSEYVVLSGKMAFWMYEGDAGCYGTLTDGTEEIQLWVDVDTCGEKDYEENQDASIEATYRSDNQYGPGKTYTITKFL